MFNSQILNKYIKQLSSTKYSAPFYENLPFVTVGSLTGIVCCGYAWLFSNIEKLSIGIFSENPYYAFVLFPCFLMFAFLAVQKIAPGASGSGIPQVIVCIDKKYFHLSSTLLTFKVLFVKIVSSLLAIFAGAGIGREGPSLQISAIIAHQIGKFFEKFKYSVRHDQLLIAGAAGGLAAAFNTPIGGIVYAIEELAQEHIRSYKTVLLLSVLISGFIAQLLLGGYLYLGYPQILQQFAFKSILAVIVVSFLAGILGSLFSKLLFKGILFRRSLKGSTQIAIVGFIGFLVAAAFFIFGQRYVFSGKESINFVLFEKSGVEFGEVIFRFFVPLLSSITGIAGGIFAPSLSAGAVFGGAIATLFDPALKSLLGLAGMIGFLSGVTRTPITSFVLVLEMTDRHSSVFPMMLAAIFSTLGSHLIGEKSYYELMADHIKEESK